MHGPPRHCSHRLRRHRTGGHRLRVRRGRPHDLASERISFTVDGAVVAHREVGDRHGGGLPLLSPTTVGRLEVEYDASVGAASGPASGWPAERLEYLRPNRYAESDRLGPVADHAFGDVSGRELVDAVSSWVGVRLAYVSGSSRPTDGAVEGAWHVVDPTSLAPRQSMVRIATGRDAADTAFMSVYAGFVNLLTVEVSAVVDGDLPRDDATTLCTLG